MKALVWCSELDPNQFHGYDPDDRDFETPGTPEWHAAKFLSLVEWRQPALQCVAYVSSEAMRQLWIAAEKGNPAAKPAARNESDRPEAGPAAHSRRPEPSASAADKPPLEASYLPPMVREAWYQYLEACRSAGEELEPTVAHDRLKEVYSIRDQETQLKKRETWLRYVRKAKQLTALPQRTGSSVRDWADLTPDQRPTRLPRRKAK